MHCLVAKFHISPLALYAILLTILVSGAFGDSLAFTGYPSNVLYNSTYTISWLTDEYDKPLTLALIRGLGQGLSMLVLLTATGVSQYQWAPSSEVVEADDYVFMLAQDDHITYSSQVYVGRTSRRSSIIFPRTSSLAATRTAPPTESSVATTMATTSSAVESTSSASVEILIPQPTSSWDAPREEDHTLTANDKIAIGIGVPIALLVLGTVGYWRAAKFFLHRKITGEPKLPMYQATKGSVPTIVIGSGLMRDDDRQSSHVPSLWGASSGRRSANSRDSSPMRGNEAIAVSAPIAGTAPATRSDTTTASSSRLPSGLRQSWMPG